MINHFGSLSKLFSANIKDFSAIHGLGNAKFAQLHAVLELAKRAINEELKVNTSLSSPQAVKNYLQLLIGNKTYESFAVLFLDIKNRLIVSEELFRGTLNHASVYPREVVKTALLHNAAAIIIAHNHPSGSCEPSRADIDLTENLQQALRLVDIKVLDHFIVANPHVYSFAEHGLM